ncbi:MAG TPA: rhomboid family intramembrane serine protease [Actinomycetota bacterium]
MIPAAVGNHCPVCAGRMREGALGQTAYRVRTKAETMPVVRRLNVQRLSGIIVGINVVIFVLMFATGAPQAQRTLVRFGALVRPLPEGQWWRLFSSMFVHIGLLHLVFNMFALTIFGPPMEERYGKARFLSLYFASGLLGGAASLTFNDGFGIAAGASGAVFGILGAWIAFYARHRNLSGARQQLQSLLMLVGINLLLGLVGPIDNFAHLGGLVAGFAMGAVFEASAKLRDGRVVAAFAAFVFIAAVSAALVVPRTCPAGSVLTVDGRAIPCEIFTGGFLQ